MAKRHRLILLLIILLVFSLVVSCSEENKKEKHKLKSRTKLTILFTSGLHGNIRSCGCAVQDMGGLGRMVTFVKRTRSKSPNSIFLDCGDDFSLDLSFTKDRANLIMECYEVMELDVFTPGEAEFIFGLDYLNDVADVFSFDVMVANLVYTKDGKRVFEPAYIIKEFDSGLKVGITGVLDDSIRFPDYINRSKFRLDPAVETLNSVAVRMKKEVDFLVVLSHMELDNTRRFLEQVPLFDIAITGHGNSKIDKVEKVGETLLLGVGGKGKFVGKLELEISKKGEVEYAAVKLEPLKTEMPIDDEVKRIFHSHGVALTDKEEGKKKYR
ncbi:bifunctional metallophosphatase/5'-nucleotidase [bacterium]|nr:bifunctional metallophosphatase/5'-nucleotidase [bacterium]